MWYVRPRAYSLEQVKNVKCSISGHIYCAHIVHVSLAGGLLKEHLKILTTHYSFDFYCITVLISELKLLHVSSAR